jgi:hypothetical protein
MGGQKESAWESERGSSGKWAKVVFRKWPQKKKRKKGSKAAKRR